ncbi:uncharacterized protein PG998_009731 [Apiospora kogelbergensis]|uniref:uncharacterized protein n=1 Tax=Apiospora kogelbergensis TaxID=1337665 RepID=UPI00312DE411
MPSMIVLGLRAAQLVFAIIIMGLSAYVANWYNVDTLTTSPSQINWLLFVSIYTIISVAYLELAPRFMPKIVHPYATIALELTNVLFYFAGFIALSVFISKLLFCRGTVCGAARADVAFGAFEFALWGATAVFMGKDVFKSGFRGGLKLGARARRRPRGRPANEGGSARLSVPVVQLPRLTTNGFAHQLPMTYSAYTEIPLSPYLYRPSLDGDKKSPGLLESNWEPRRSSSQFLNV